MKYMMVVKATKESEAGVMPTNELIMEMGKFNEEMVKAGMMLDGAGLESSAKGARVQFENGKPTVTKGPFANTSELISGYWLVKANSLDEVIAWAKRVPFKEGQVEIRRLFEMEDFEPGEGMEREKELSKEIARQKEAA